MWSSPCAVRGLPVSGSGSVTSIRPDRMGGRSGITTGRVITQAA